MAARTLDNAAKLQPKITSKIRYKNTLGGCNLPFTANFNIGRSFGKSPQVWGAGKVGLNRFPLSSDRESAEMVRKTKPRVTADSQTNTSVLFMPARRFGLLYRLARHTRQTKGTQLCQKPPRALFGFVENNEVRQSVECL